MPQDTGKVKSSPASAIPNPVVYQQTQIGLLAQDLQKVYPDLVVADKQGTLGINYSGLVAVLVAAAKEQQSQIEDLKQQIEDCCSNNLKSASISSDQGIQISENSARLYQNAPNPFSTQTIIKFEIPETVSTSQLYICNMNGTLLKTIPVNQRGEGSVTISGNEFMAGMYLYSLVDDGKIVDTKQMLLTE